MNKTESKHGVRWGLLLVGILFIICSLIAFWDPASNLETLVIVFAIMAIVNGIWLISRVGISRLRIVAGVLEVILGVFMLFNIGWAMLALPYVFAIWFLIDSLFRLFTVGVTRIFGTGYFVFSIIINILGVILGVMLLFQPVTAALTLSFLVGFYLLLAGIQCLVSAFANH